MQLPLFSDRTTSSAFISPCGLYRYTLVRSWEPTRSMVNWIMLNPSTADAEQDDATIRRCLAFSRSWGHGSLAVTNLYAYRATDPRELGKAADPVGPENDAVVRSLATIADLVILAWGNHGASRAPAVLEMLREARARPHYLRLTGRRQPAHPLYLPADLAPIPWTLGPGGAS